MINEKQKLIDIIADFAETVAIYLSDDVYKKLNELADGEKQENAKTMYECMLKDLKLADELHRPICQDTGVLQFFLDVGTKFPYINDLKDIIEKAIVKATEKTPLRPNIVDPIGEHNTGNNIGCNTPYIEYNLVPDSSDLTVKLYMAGGGCSLPGRSKVLMPLEGIEGVKKFVYETITEWGVNACPPLTVGIGLGTCAATSAVLSKKALLRPIGIRNENEDIAKLEEEFENELNSIGIAPLGFGGTNSVLGVNIECAGRHPATRGVGLTTGCWATRKGEMVIHSDLNAELLSHKRLKRKI
ncbi:MAG: L(+)-tartrate dehydratase subunit alpha [Clostridia bacterium]|nr:L(+)-tartrate dehydratase subunit alpha [Clostridia bacterium]